MTLLPHHKVLLYVDNGQQPVIGIKNSSGTACHISSSFIILYYCLHPIMDVIQVWYDHVVVINNEYDESNHNNQYKFIHDLIQFMKEIQYCQNQNVDNVNNNNKAVNPIDFYFNIKETLHIEANDFGDAITTLNKILYHITKTITYYQSNNNMESQFSLLLSNDIKSLIDTILYNGTTQSILCGTKMIETKDGFTKMNNDNNDNKRYRIMKQIKKLQIQSLCNPIILPIPTDVESISLMDIIQHVLYDHRIIEGEYNWNNGTNFIEQIESYNCTDDDISETANVTDKWKTTKCMGVMQYPPIVMLHLQRFHMISTTSTGRSQLKPLNTNVEIPLSINLSVPDTDMIVKDKLEFPTTTQECPLKINTYELIGGIIHVTDNDNDNQLDTTTTWYDELENEYGHYVSVIRREVVVEDNNHHYQWFLINDEHVIMITENIMLQLLGGKKVEETIHNDIDNDDNNKTSKETTIDFGTYRGVLLVYQQIDYLQTTIQPLWETIQEHIRMMHDMKRTEIPFNASSSSCTHHAVPTINHQCSNNIKHQMDDTETNTIYNENLIGRRLEIKWAKGKYYQGNIISYNTITGKHCVKYDDGDMKHYHLHKKTIRWIE